LDRLVSQKWIESDNIWLQRTAIICHRFDKIELDFELMEEMILRRADSKEFFIQKGAGWALRDYSKVNPDRVVAFIKKKSTISKFDQKRRT
jgi:3-methyladenine DNA glycosylase AlkD